MKMKVKVNQKLSVGDKVLYKTDTLIDNPVVISLDEGNSTAKLSNNVIVKNKIKDGFIKRADRNPFNYQIRVWDDETEKEFKVFKYKKEIPSLLERISKLNSLNIDETLELHSKLIRVLNRFEKHE